MTKDEIADCIKNEIALALQIDPNEIDEDIFFMKLGLSSVQTLKIINRIRKKIDTDINPVAMFEHKSISKFAEYLSDSMVS